MESGKFLLPWLIILAIIDEGHGLFSKKESYNPFLLKSSDYVLDHYEGQVYFYS